jgi:large subunit ribosomal protein L3
MTTAGLIAKKIGMTRMVDPEGRVTPVTLLQVEQQKVTKRLTLEKDGYEAIQVGYQSKAVKHLSKADLGRLNKAGVEEKFCRFKELRLGAGATAPELGQSPDFIAALEGVKSIDVTGITKGRGFSGAHVRWNSAVGRMSHGSRFHRSPGSLGMRSTPGRVMKNRHQPGQYGSEQITVLNLDVLDLDQESRVIAVRGSVPGHKDGFLVIRPSIKAKKPTVAKKS